MKIANQKITTLTNAEDKAYCKAFSYYKDKGNTDSQADKNAAKDLIKEFPRLKNFTKWK